MHTPQPRKCLEIYRLIANREVISFDERQAELSREIRMLEISLVERTGREDDSERSILVFSKAEHLLAQCAEEAAHRANAQLSQYVGEDPRNDLTILQCIPS